MADLVPAAAPFVLVGHQVPLDQHPAAVYLGSLGVRSKRVQKDALNRIAALLPLDLFPGNLAAPGDYLAANWAEVRYKHAAAIRAALAEAYAPATANRMLAALRGVLESAWRLGLMSADEKALAQDVDNVEGQALPAGRALSAGELLALMHSCENDPTPAGARDAGLIACMYPGGLRRAEVVALDLADFNSETGALVVRHGKRNKARKVYLSNGAARALGDWLALRGDDPGALFWPVNKGGVLLRRRMTHQAVYNVLKKRGDQAGVVNFSPHDLRRTFIGDLLDAGADIAIVARLAGHSNVTTTQRYDRRPEQAKQKAAGLLHLPYRGRLL